jgi:hypothetical protein
VQENNLPYFTVYFTDIIFTDILPIFTDIELIFLPIFYRGFSAARHEARVGLPEEGRQDRVAVHGRGHQGAGDDPLFRIGSFITFPGADFSYIFPGKNSGKIPRKILPPKMFGKWNFLQKKFQKIIFPKNSAEFSAESDFPWKKNV